jgi:hypothetical protein
MSWAAPPQVGESAVHSTLVVRARDRQANDQTDPPRPLDAPGHVADEVLCTVGLRRSVDNICSQDAPRKDKRPYSESCRALSSDVARCRWSRQASPLGINGSWGKVS